jgi:hypothetical protein
MTFSHKDSPANLGDSGDTNAALTSPSGNASPVRTRWGGMFEFSWAKQYYHASSLIRLNGATATSGQPEKLQKPSPSGNRSTSTSEQHDSHLPVITLQFRDRSEVMEPYAHQHG